MSVLGDTYSSSCCSTQECGTRLLVSFSFCVCDSTLSNISIALLPSSFAMYTTTAAFAASIAPSSFRQPQRALYATLLFATGAIAGWPFSLALAIPFVIEELFIASGDRVPSSVMLSWMSGRWSRLFKAGAFASLILVSNNIAIPCATLKRSIIA